MKTTKIIRWNEEMTPINGNWKPAYQVVFSVSAWVKTPEQKRAEKLAKLEAKRNEI